MLAKDLKVFVESNFKYLSHRSNTDYDFTQQSKYIVNHSRKVRITGAISFGIAIYAVLQADEERGQ